LTLVRCDGAGLHDYTDFSTYSRLDNPFSVSTNPALTKAKMEYDVDDTRFKG
jgi:hypothetical protein